MIDLSIIIINYKTPEITCNCINSIYQYEPDLNFEIIVVDNFSNDNSKELILKNYSQVSYIQMEYNSGFSRANNVGIKNSNGNYILFLNSDTLIYKKNSIKKCLSYYRTKEAVNNVGLLGCKLLNTDKTLQYSSFKKFYSITDELKNNPLYIKIFDDKRKSKLKTENKLNISHKETHNTSWLCGAFLMTKKSIIIENNLFFDEDFFLYSEDVELSNRFIKKNLKNIFYSDISIIHLSGKSSAKSEKKQLQIILSLWLLYKKINGKLWYKILFLVFKINYKLDYLLNKNVDNLTIKSQIQLRKKAIESEHLVRKGKFFSVYN